MNYCNMFECYKGQALRDKQAIRAKRGSQLVRIISQRITGLVMNSSEGTPCEFKGAMAPFMVNTPRDMGYNCTAFTDIQGELRPDGNYTGYVGQLQHETADFGFIFAQLPLPGDPVDYSTVFSAEKISFATLYKRPYRPTGPSDILESMFQIDLLSICVFVTLYALCVAVLKITQQKRPWFRLVAAQFQDVGLSETTFGLKCLSLTIIVFFFMFNQFCHNFILAGLVREKNPKVLKHFFDILDPEVDLHVGRTFMIRDILRNSRIERVRAVAEKIDRLTLENVLIKETNDIYKIFAEPNNRLFSYLNGQNLLKSNRLLLCSVVPHADSDVKQSLWIPQDSPYEFLTTASYSKALDKGIKQVLDVALMHAFEHQVYSDIWRSQMERTLQELLMPGSKPDPLCYSDAILVERASQSENITLSNVFMTLLILFLLYFLAAVGLLLENRNRVVVSRVRRKRKKRRKRLCFGFCCFRACF
ncbi:hypothetical protein HDE_04133 [Halotydeus destructor]|nr:hypothetical protein HDE_04133 [Halotydeus destructor]